MTELTPEAQKVWNAFLDHSEWEVTDSEVLGIAAALRAAIDSVVPEEAEAPRAQFDCPPRKLYSFKKDGWEGIDYDYCEGERKYYLYQTRIENDEEYEKRVKQEEQRKENRRKQYEQLKKEFGEDT